MHALKLASAKVHACVLHGVMLGQKTWKLDLAQKSKNPCGPAGFWSSPTLGGIFSWGVEAAAGGDVHCGWPAGPSQTNTKPMAGVAEAPGFEDESQKVLVKK